MPLLLPPFGRGGPGNGLPSRLQPIPQEAEVLGSNPKRPGYSLHAPPSGRIRFNWTRQTPGMSLISAKNSCERRQDCPDEFTSAVSFAQEKERGEQEKEGRRREETEKMSGTAVVFDLEEFPALPSRKFQGHSSKIGSRLENTDSEMSPPAGCPLQSTGIPPPPPPPGAAPSGPVPSGPSPYLFPPPANFQVPFSPYLVVPHMDNSAPINVNVKSSSDPTGADLPMNDAPTLRFFFNLGLEYYRLCMIFQLQQQQQYAAFLSSQQIGTAASGSVAHLEGAVYAADLEDMHGQSSCKDDTSDKKDKAIVDQKTEKIVEQGQISKSVGKEGSESEERKETDVRVEEIKEELLDDEKIGQVASHCEEMAGDSGCASDTSSGNEGGSVTEDCCDVPQDIAGTFDDQSDNSDNSNMPNDSQSDSSSQHSTSALSVISSSSSTGSDCGSALLITKSHFPPPRTRFNSTKLLKPLKDIPPRFQKMLSCNPAIKQEQFEGQPIVRQQIYNYHQKPKSVIVSANNLKDLPIHHNFNPYAEVFIPRQPCSSSTNVNNPCSSSTNNPCMRPHSSSGYSYHPNMPFTSSDCCSSSTGTVEGTSSSAGRADGAMVNWTPSAGAAAPPTTQTGSSSTPTYTIHIHSAGCTIEPAPAPAPAPGGCSHNGINHVISAPTPAGCYAVSNTLPANPVSTNAFLPHDATGATPAVVGAAPVPAVPAPPPPPPPPPPPAGGMVYYCQHQQQQQPENFSHGYPTSTYTLPSQGTPQYVYSTAAPTAYQTYENYS